MNPLVSVIVPVFNVEKYIEDCVNSIINQTYKNIEIILVDDGSTDDSGFLCNEFVNIDKRIKVIHKKNEGVVLARIEGLKNSNGQYIIFVDADDFIKESFIDIMYKNLVQYNADLVCCQYYNYYDNDEKKSPVCPKVGYYDKNDIEKILKNQFLYDKNTGKAGISPYLWGKLIKREYIIKSINATKELFYGEDHVCILDVLYNINSMIVINNYLYVYRKRAGQVTAKYQEKLWNNHEKMLNIFITIDKEFYLSEQINSWCFLTVIGIITRLFDVENITFQNINKTIYKYRLLKICQNARKAEYYNFNNKLKLKLFFLKNDFFILYYILFKLKRKFVKQ